MGVLLYEGPILPKPETAIEEKTVPQGGADKSVHAKRYQPHLTKSRGNGNQMPHHGDEPTDKNCPRSVTRKPPFGPFQVFMIEQEISADLQNQGTASVISHVI